MVSLDARWIGHAGIGRFIQGLWGGLQQLGVDSVALIPETPAGWRHEGPTLPGRLLHTRLKPLFLMEQLLLPRVLRRAEVDAHHATHLSVPYLARVPVILTVHDLFPVKWPRHARSRAAALYYRTVFPAALRRADAVIAVSDYTRRMIEELMPDQGPRVETIEHGVDTSTWHPVDESQVGSVLEHLGVKRPYVLYSGTAKWHKNLPVLLAALDAGVPQLVMAGPTSAEVMQAVSGGIGSGSIVALGRVAESMLPALYSGAEFLVLPSLHESFGFAALEAMACGTAVLCSDGGCLPELYGTAAEVIPADDVGAWSESMKRLWADEARRTGMARQGLELASRRPWTAAAAAYEKVYERVLGRAVRGRSGGQPGPPSAK